MLNVYHYVYRDSDYEFRPSKKDLIFFEWLGSTNRLPAYLKWKTANILARAVGSMEYVPCPFAFDVIPGLFNDYLQDNHLGIASENGFHRMKLARKRDSRYVRFCFSLYQAKSASLPADTWEIEQNVHETVHRLSQPKDIDTVLMLPSGRFTRDDLECEIIRTVDEVFPVRSERPGRFRVPTQGSEFHVKRSEGGSLQALMRRLGYTFLPYEYLDSFFEGPLGGTPVYVRYLPDDISLAFVLSRNAARSCPDLIPCRPLGLVEPFKVRVITKGWGPAYEVARSYQPRIWETLKEHPTFRLVGETINQRAMSQFASQLDPQQDDWIISGDYKQATDHIPSDMARLLYERVCARTGVPFEDVPALLGSLTDHWIQTTSSSGSRVHVQRSGQLMGSPSSFPILCLYNATLSRIAYERCREDRSHLYLDEIPMLVNGDDLLLGGDLWTYLTWQRVVRWGGLLPSVGKTLVSRDWGTINSTLFRFKRTSDFGVDHYRITHVPHLAVQLAIGSIKSGRVDSEGKAIGNNSPLDEENMFRLFMESTRNKERGWRFLYGVNRRKIADRLRRFPRIALCLPTQAGGLGFPLPPPASEYYPKRIPRPLSLKVARLLLDHPDRTLDLLRTSWAQHLANKETPLLMREQGRLLSQTGCVWQPVPIDSIEPLLPPTRFCFSYGDAFAKQRTDARIHLQLVKAALTMDRKPWTLAEVVDFLRVKRWTCRYGRYSSGLEPCRSYPHLRWIS